MRKKEERRGFLRVDESVPVTYHRIESPSVKATSTLDISGGGLKIVLSEEIEKGAILQLKINLPNSLSPIFCVGKVVWCGREKTNDGEKIMCGVAFLDIHPDDRKNIIEYVFFHNYKPKIDEEVSILTINLTKVYRSAKIIDNVNLKIMPGEIFTLVGFNSAGKTTLLKILSTLLPPTSGNAKIANYDIFLEKNKIRKYIGYMPQTPSLLPDLTARENLCSIARKFFPEKKIYDIVEESLAFAEVPGKGNILFKTLPWGTKQRLSLASSLLHKPKILFLDEPTSGIDFKTHKFFWEHFHKLSQNKVTVFITTSQPEEGVYSHKVAFLEGGKILINSTPHKIRKLKPTKVYIFCDNRNYTLKTTNYTEELPSFLQKEIKDVSKIKKIEIKEPSFSEVFLSLTETVARKSGDTRQEVEV